VQLEEEELRNGQQPSLMELPNIVKAINIRHDFLIRSGERQSTTLLMPNKASEDKRTYQREFTEQRVGAFVSKTSAFAVHRYQARTVCILA
jgi:hypothetical protein